MENNTTLKDSIYNLVLEGIFTNEFRPNQILNEKQLVERYGCSKSPVREGLLALCKDHVLRSIPRCGYEVIRLTREDVENMQRTRYLLEGGALCMTYDKFSPAQLKRLEEADAACTQAKSDIYKHWEHNTKFHRCLLAPVQNEYMQEILEHTMNRLKRAYFQFFWDRVDEFDLSEDTRNHQHIIKALRQKNKEAVLSDIRDDLQAFGDFRCEVPAFFSPDR